jgi:hypothetical protein
MSGQANDCCPDMHYGAAMTTATHTTTWHVSGTYFEACSCDAICPCRSVGGRDGSRSTYGVCEFALSWWVQEGHFGDIRLDGLKVAMAGFYVDDEPGSPWQVCLYVDAAGDAAQQAALADIFLGKAGGGTWSNFATAIGQVHAVRSARIELQHQPGDWAIGVEGYIRVQANEAVLSEETVACGIPGLDRPGQEVRCEVLAVADAPLGFEMQGRCGFATDFEYTS